MAWNEGYVTEVPYTYGYYSDLSPARVNLALTMAGHAPIPAGPCCELGFGQGVCLAFNAVADPAREWWGTDFNPAHVQHARSLIDAAGVHAHLFDDSFEQFASRTDLPQFSYIALHGIWSWVSEENRSWIVEFLRRNLAPGGVVYVSYNAAAGWAASVPLQQLLSLYASRAQAPGVPPTQRMQAALDFAQRVFALDPALVAQSPGLQKRLDTLRAQDPVYLTHEYLNANWHPCSFAEMAASMDAAKLTYAGSASLLDYVGALQTTDAQRALLREIGDPVLRQTTRDFLIGQAFRRDLWVRGLPRLGPHGQSVAWRRQQVVLATTMPKEPIRVKGARAEATLPERVTTPILGALDQADAPMEIGEIERRVVGPGFSTTQFSDAMVMLLGSGRVEAAAPEPRLRAAATCSERLNAYVIERSAEQGALAYLLSPVSGCGVFVPRITQLLLAGSRAGCTTTAEYVDDAYRRLLTRGEGLSAEGRPLESPEMIRAEIAKAVEGYLEMIPALRRLQVL